MENMKDILKYHIKHYPLMQPVDVVKLVFQSEFGGGHLIKDSRASLERIINEVDDMERLAEERKKKVGEEGFLVPIGNDIVRVNLANLKENHMTAELLNDCFISSARQVKGNVEGLKNKLSIATNLVKAGEFSFYPEEFMAYLDEYTKAGYPMVSHSETYRKLYIPAYRVVCLGEIKKVL